MAVMQIPRRVDYGLRAVIYLARQDPGKSCSLPAIARQQGIPLKFLEKIIRDLSRSGLVRSKRGPDGGYCLARLPSEITFQEVIETLEGPIAVNVCMDPRVSCSQMARCTMVGIWSEVQRKIVDVFNRTTLADVQGASCSAEPASSSLSGAA